MRITDRRRWAAVLASVTLALGQTGDVRGDGLNFWQRSENKSQVVDPTNNTNWAAKQMPPPGTNVPIGPPPKQNMFKRAASGIGSATSSVTNGVKGMFQRKTPATGETPVTTKRPKQKPLDANFHVTLAGMQEQAKNYPGAEEQYQRALEIEPNHLHALLGYGRFYDRQERYAEALTFYQKATKAHPNEPAAWNDLGLCHSRMNRMNEASTALERAASLDPHKKLYRNNLATVLVKMNRPDDALRHLAAVHPKPVANYNVGFLLTQQDDRQLAYRYFNEAALADPNLKQAREWRDLLAPLVASAPQQRQPTVQAQTSPASGPGSNPVPRVAERPMPPQQTIPAPQPPAMGPMPSPPGPVNTPSLPPRAAPAPMQPPLTQRATISSQQTAAPAGAQPAPATPPTRPQPRMVVAEKPAAHLVPKQQPAEEIQSAPSVDPSEPPLPAADDVAEVDSPSEMLAAPRPERIGTPSGSHEGQSASTAKRAKRTAAMAPSRY